MLVNCITYTQWNILVSMKVATLVFIGLLCGCGLSACGQSGPLYHPDSPPPIHVPTP